MLAACLAATRNSSPKRGERRSEHGRTARERLCKSPSCKDKAGSLFLREVIGIEVLGLEEWDVIVLIFTVFLCDKMKVVRIIRAPALE